MTVLGWARHITQTPTGVHQHRVGGWALLLGCPDDSPSARDRLALQVRCFDAGIAFVPTAPAHQLPLLEAIDLCQTKNLSDQLRKLEGRGQFTLVIESKDQQSDPINAGRDWLQARKARRDQQDRHDRQLADLAKQLGLPSTTPRHRQNASHCDILVNRADADRVRQGISRAALAMDSTPDTLLTVTGLWPAFGFSQMSDINAGAL